MNAEDKVLAFLKEQGGTAKRGALAMLDMSPVTLGRAVRTLIVQGHVDACLRITEAGMRVKPKARDGSWRKPPEIYHDRSIRHPPQQVFKEVTEEDLSRIRSEALAAREFGAGLDSHPDSP